MCVKILISFLFLLIVVALPLFYKQYFLNSEGFSNYYLGSTDGMYPSSQTDVLVQDTYPITGKNGVSNDGSNKIWWHYPIFEVGSYKQITNNIRYPYNPDTGRCMPANFCGALYKDKHLKSNYTEQLPPVNPTAGTRVGYFTTDVNMLPFRTDEPNVLY
jgi:hypothetical protein